LIKAELSRALQDIGTWQQEGRVKCEALETAPADQLPELPAPVTWLFFGDFGRNIAQGELSPTASFGCRAAA
jgi:hypothetical protein